MRKHLNENEFDLHENEHVGGRHFHVNGQPFPWLGGGAQAGNEVDEWFRLVLTRRQKRTRRWPIKMFNYITYKNER